MKKEIGEQYNRRFPRRASGYRDKEAWVSQEIDKEFVMKTWGVPYDKISIHSTNKRTPEGVTVTRRNDEPVYIPNSALESGDAFYEDWHGEMIEYLDTVTGRTNRQVPIYAVQDVDTLRPLHTDTSKDRAISVAKEWAGDGKNVNVWKMKKAGKVVFGSETDEDDE